MLSRHTKSSAVFLPRWDDQQGQVGSVLTGPAVWTMDTYRDTGFTIPCLRHDQDDVVELIFQFKHIKKLQTSINLHVHSIPLAATGGNVYWSYKYTWVQAEVIIPANTEWSTGNITMPIASNDLYKEKIFTLLSINPPTVEKYSDILLIKLTRLGSNQLDTYSTNKDHGTVQANIGILYFDCHFNVNKLGSLLEFTD